MHIIKTIGICAALALGSTPAFSNVTLGATRLIINQTDQSSAFSVRNSGTTPLLIQSWVNSNEKNVKPPFAITPPLFRLESKQENTLRVLQLPNQLPHDQESLFWLNVKEIPPLDKNLAGKMSCVSPSTIASSCFIVRVACREQWNKRHRLCIGNCSHKEKGNGS
jgi:P pilus assembly chaperone PapD